MADEKLPEYVEEAIAEYAISAMRVERGSYGALEQSAADESALRLAISRFAREREAAALERAAKACDRVAGGGEMKTIGLPFTHDGGKVYDHGANYCAWEIRALIHKEPANG